MQLTLQGTLRPTERQEGELDRLMLRQSSAMRSAYCRMCEGKNRYEVREDLKDKFPDLNRRYRYGAYFRAKYTKKSVDQLIAQDRMNKKPSQIVFGKARNLERRSNGKISREAWREKRNNQLYCRGESDAGGNLNLRLVNEQDNLHLRINVGTRQYERVPAWARDENGILETLLQSNTPYGVRVLKHQGNYDLRVSFDLGEPQEPNTDNGVVGVDVNEKTVDLAVTNSQGQLIDHRTLNVHSLSDMRQGKRENRIHHLAKQVVEYARHHSKPLVLEDLNDVSREKSNQNRFTHRKIQEAIKRRAFKQDATFKSVNPAHTTTIGQYKYSSYYQINKDVAAALVISRRGQGYTEKLRGLSEPIFAAMEAGEIGERDEASPHHAWSLWNLLGEPAVCQGPDRTHPDHGTNPRGSPLERQGTSGPAKAGAEG